MTVASAIGIVLFPSYAAVDGVHFSDLQELVCVFETINRL